ncbi:MAG: hypothetical protein ACK4FF_10615 [Limnobacter sp.]|uniref:hypothetical protein n=1 Tax=Limnobacter sp. TaxID=2003368 RepID=UPI003919A63B
MSAKRLRCELQTPTLGGPTPQGNDALTVAGWVALLAPPDIKPELLSRIDGQTWQPLDSQQGLIADQPKAWSFKQALTAQHTIRIAVRLNDQLIQLFLIALSPEGCKSVYAQHLQDQLSDGCTRVSPLLAPTDGRTLGSHIAAYASRLNILTEHEWLTKAVSLPERLAALVNKYRLYVRTHQNLVDMVSTPAAPTLKHPVSDKPATATHGGYFHWHTFWLRFSDGEESFYIIQKVSAIDGVFIPSQNLLLKFQHLDSLDASLLIANILNELDLQVRKGYGSHFVGFNVSHPRPAHLLQDVLPGLAVLDEQQRLNSNIPISLLAGGDYLEPSQCFPALAPSKTVSLPLEPGAYLSLMGAPMTYNPPGQLPPSFYQALFSRLVGMAERKEADWTVRQQIQSQAYFVLWLGISAQKRVWLNQSEGLAKVIALFQRQFPNLLVAFDGWTAPARPLQTDLAEIQRDRLVMIEVLNRLPVRPAHVDLIGQTMSKKIAVAQYANFYFTSALTGSVWVSRAFQKKGILHISNPLRDIAVEHQANPHALLLPASLVTEVDADKAPRFDCINYSIELEGLIGTIKAFTPELDWGQ